MAKNSCGTTAKSLAGFQIPIRSIRSTRSTESETNTQIPSPIVQNDAVSIIGNLVLGIVSDFDIRDANFGNTPEAILWPILSA
jgi:hypothetical protein